MSPRLYPLTFQQEGLWISAQVSGKPGSLNVPVAFRVLGSLDEERLVESVRGVVAGHDALRTTFLEDRGKVAAVVGDVPRIDVQRVDLRSAPGDRTTLEECRALAVGHALRPMSLDEGPLVRLAIYRCGAQDFVVVLTVHHIVVDAYSFGLLWREIADGYATSARRRSDPGAGSSYGAFAATQRAGRTDAELRSLVGRRARDLDGAASYEHGWRRQGGAAVAGAEPKTVRTRVLAPALALRLRRIAQELFASDFALLLTVFRLALWRTTGVADGVVAIPVSGRNEPGTERTVGYFLDLHAQRSRVEPEEPFESAVAREFEGVLGALDVPELSLWRVRDALGARSSGIGDVTFTMRSADGPALSLEGCAVQPFHLGSGQPVWTLAVDVAQEADGSLTVVAQSDSHVVGARAVDDLLAAFTRIARDVADDPGRAVGALGDRPPEVRLRSAPGVPAALCLREGHGVPVFCLPALGGSPAVYLPLAGHLPGGAPVWGLQVDETVTRYAHDLHELADACATAIRRVQPTGPYRLVGWSFGGVLAHTVAAALDGHVDLLVMIDSTLWADGAVGSDTELVAEHFTSNIAKSDRSQDAETVARRFVGYLREHQPIRLPVDVSFIVGDSPGGHRGDRWPEAMWGPYTGGRLVVHEVEATHQELTGPRAALSLGKIIAEALQEPAR